MPLPFEGDPALLGQLLVGVSEVDQERRRRQDRKQERSLLVAVPAVFGTLQRIEDIMGDPMQPNIAEECCKKNCLQRLVIDRDSYGSELHRGLKTLQQARVLVLAMYLTPGAGVSRRQ